MLIEGCVAIITPKLLFADDCLEDRETYRRYLLGDKQRTYNILEAETGEEALLFCCQQIPDVILLDYLLPDMDGLEILSQLKTQFGKTNLPVIMLTGQGNEQIAVQAMKSGAADYLVKRDTTSQSLRLAIQNILESVSKPLKDEVCSHPREFFGVVENSHKSIFTVDTDLTEKKQLSAQFSRAQRLESLGIIASAIAHDLNNVLTPILIIAQLLPLHLPNCNEQNRQLLTILEDNSKRGVELVKQILSYARGAQGKRVPLQIKYLLKEIEQTAKNTFPKSIEIRTNIPAQDIWMVSADSTQLHQVLMNLCVNARDAMPQGGTLTISAENLFCDQNCVGRNLEAEVGDYVLITVSDTGCGIPQELLEQIFQPFFTTKDTSQGTGLGLSIVVNIIKNHGGFVKVYSEVGKGSQFQVYLPANDAEAML
ncbi:response regulator [aff. Roholtiella sp. LEGE 12411]|nr:response regulator [aff. Roholtiella sp. LEGE 12411]